ncbi:MAG: DUF1552 domain-containing protein [Myxococcota bacterium]|nr:DUF1552 domain-containing protein [Myxococcota bacterium]
MRSYRFARRSFLCGIGAAFGLEGLLRNMEAAALGIGPPPRFLMMHWPVGTVRDQFIPNGSGTSYTTSKAEQGPGYIISPFDTPGLREHTIAFHGFNMDGIRGEGGGHEDGTPFATTGASSPGTRANGGEADDGCAGGPSWDQIFLERVPGLSKRNDQGTIIGKGYYNTICDRRVDSYETSTRCLSYGYERRAINSARPGGTLRENKPLLPEMSPLTAYKDLFGGFAPDSAVSDREALKLLKLRKSVLDYSLRELQRLKALGPASERDKIDGHAEAIRKLEAQLSDQILGGNGRECSLPPLPDATLTGRDGESLRADYDQLQSNSSDEATHEAVGKAHAAILRTAFACDVIRVATFQWSPGTNHVSFRGLDPNSPDTIWMHHPLSHQVVESAFFNGPRPAEKAYIWDAMVNANRWYFQKTADIVDAFRLQVDPLDPAGSSLLDNTVIPMITEVAEASHTREGHAALVFGGKRLGMQGGQYQSVSGIHNRLWVTLAQAFLGAGAVELLSNEAYVKRGADAIPGVWVAPT